MFFVQCRERKAAGIRPSHQPPHERARAHDAATPLPWRWMGHWWLATVAESSPADTAYMALVEKWGWGVEYSSQNGSGGEYSVFGEGFGSGKA